MSKTDVGENKALEKKNHSLLWRPEPFNVVGAKKNAITSASIKAKPPRLILMLISS